MLPMENGDRGKQVTDLQAEHVPFDVKDVYTCSYVHLSGLKGLFLRQTSKSTDVWEAMAYT